MSTIDYPEQQVWKPKNRTYLGTKTAEPDRLEYTGGRGELFWLALSRMLMTILTLGIGRFWMTTRLRRFYWSSISIGGEPLEYTGRAGEKLIGFLIAVVILAVYLVFTSLLLTFAGFAVYDGDPIALSFLQLSILPLFPLGFWAQYRARRYILARTRWRGIRFGLAPGAWGYMWRALGWGFLTLVTAGLLYPLMQLKLSRYLTDRSHYGSLRFTQEGRLRPLMISWMWVWMPVAVVAAVGLFGAFQYFDFSTIGDLEALGDGDGKRLNERDESTDPNPFSLAAGAIGGGAMIVALFAWVTFALIHHRIFSFRYLNSNKVLEGGTRFDFRIGMGSIIGIYIVGSIVIWLLVGIIAGLLIGLSFGIMAALGIDPRVLREFGSGELTGLSELLSVIPVIVGYLPGIAAYIALRHAFFTHPLLKEVAATVTVNDLSAANEAAQRAHDEQAEAGGFADALGADIGGAF
ncbi:MAG: DUF898 family protein [Pseudomonadota bacterium]